MINEQTQKLAERIALLLQQENERPAVAITGGDEFSLVRASLEKINQRLDKIESQLFTQNPHTQAQNPKSFHSSQERFENLEEISHQIINSSTNDKACPFEPAGKPCDHCAMCSARGF